jgi:protein-tyrosine phosphatase
LVDIHSHIFWGVDDGADTRETALSMLRVARESGTTDIVGTPHANAESAPDAGEIDRQMDDLNGAVNGKPPWPIRGSIR